MHAQIKPTKHSRRLDPGQTLLNFTHGQGHKGNCLLCEPNSDYIPTRIITVDESDTEIYIE